MALTTETGHQNFIVLFNIIQATIPWYESCNFLSVLDQLYSDALANSRVGLFGFNATVEKKRTVVNTYVIVLLNTKAIGFLNSRPNFVSIFAFYEEDIGAEEFEVQ